GTIGPWVTAALAYSYWRGGAPAVRLVGWAKPSQSIITWDEGNIGWRYLAGRISMSDPDVFLWFQGENDAVLGIPGKTYQTKLETLIARVRQQRGKNIPVLIVGLANAPAGYEGGYWTIREAQKAAAATTGAFYLSAEGLPTDGAYHLTEEGMKALGQRIAL